MHTPAQNLSNPTHEKDQTPPTSPPCRPRPLPPLPQAYQVFKARASGADAILLIAAVLPNADLSYLIKAARALGLQVLIEVRGQGARARCWVVEKVLGFSTPGARQRAAGALACCCSAGAGPRRSLSLCLPPSLGSVLGVGNGLIGNQGAPRAGPAAWRKRWGAANGTPAASRFAMRGWGKAKRQGGHAWPPRVAGLALPSLLPLPLPLCHLGSTNSCCRPLPPPAASLPPRAPQVHTTGELERVLALGEGLEGCFLGINNRDLQTFKVDLAHTAAIMESAAGQQVCVCGCVFSAFVPLHLPAPCQRPMSHAESLHGCYSL